MAGAGATAARRPAVARWVWQRTAVYWLGALPAAWAVWLATTDQLGADPVKTLERFLGLWALRFLILGLAVTPLRQLGGPNLVRYRRALGLLAFGYAVLHLLVYIALDQAGNLGAVWADIVKRPFITIGMAAFVILVPLALSSSTAAIRRLGATTWQRLHRWVYVAVALGAIHFILSVKAWPPEPLVYAAIIAALLLWRVWWASPLRPARQRARTSA